MNSFSEIPTDFLNKWQRMADLLAKVISIPAALIMKTEDEFIEVFISSKSKNNPYKPGDKEKWYGLYCETVIKSQKELLIPNALKDKDWDKNPDVKLGMIAYLGLPLNFPDKTHFGTICVLDNKEKNFTEEQKQLLQQFKDVIELDLALIQTIKINNPDNITHELLQQNKELFNAREKAEKGEINWQTTFDAIDDIVMLLSVDHDVVEINKAGIEALQLPSEEIVGKKCFHLVHNTSEPILECPCKISLKERKSTKKEYSKGNKTYQLIAYPIINKNNEITHFTHIVKDITDAKIKEIKISGLSEIIKNSLNEIYIFDKETFQFKFANNGALKNTGYSIHEIKEITPLELKPEYTLKTFQELITPLVNKEKGIIHLETIHQRKDGSQYDVSINIQLFEYENEEVFVAFISDISKEKEAEKEIRQQKKLFETMFDTIQEGIVITNTNREIVLANKGMLTTFGHHPDDIIGKQTKILYADIKKFEDTGKKIFNKEAPAPEKNYITYYKHKNGKEFPGETFGTKLYDEKGNWIGNIGIMRDISERMKFIDDLKQAKEKAEESDRLKTAFLQNLSHEIRTPLNAISGFTGMLSKPRLTQEKRNSFVSIIQTSSKQLLSIVNDILTISSLETNQEKVNIEEVNINEIIIEMLAIFRQQASNHNLSIYPKQPLNNNQALVYTDKTKITQILSNIISNALKFTHEGSVNIGYELKNHELEFYVKDSGIGIDKKDQEIIFERFNQADKNIQQTYGGTGLGLTISKGFAELLGGKIRVESEVGKGSTFYFTTPYKPVNKNDGTATSTNISENDNDTPIILIAEDEEFNFLYIEELLIDLDYKLIHARNGQEAVELFKANSDISLILMDIKMPIMSGHTAAKIIKEQNPEIPIIAQSAYALEHEIEEYGEIFDEYLAKPIKAELLIEKAKKYL